MDTELTEMPQAKSMRVNTVDTERSMITENPKYPNIENIQVGNGNRNSNGHKDSVRIQKI